VEYFNRLSGWRNKVPDLYDRMTEIPAQDVPSIPTREEEMQVVNESLVCDDDLAVIDEFLAA